LSKELSSDELQFWGLPLVTEFFEVKKHLPSYEPVALLPASVIHNEKFEVRDIFYSQAMCMLVVATGCGINVKDVFKSIASLGNHQAECATIEIYSVSDGLGDQKNFRLHCKIEPKQPVTCIDFDEKTQLLAAGLESGFVNVYQLRILNQDLVVLEELHSIKCSKTGISRVSIDPWKKLLHVTSGGKKIRIVSFDPPNILLGGLSSWQSSKQRQKTSA